MNRISKGFFAGLALALMLTLPAAAQTKIATIDLRKVFDNYWKRQQAASALNDRRGVMEKEMKGIMDDEKKAEEEYNKLLAAANDQSVTHEEREKRKSAAEAKLLDIKTIENTARKTDENDREQLETQMKRMRESILQDIRAAVTAKAKASGFSMVIDIAAETVNQTPTILYTNGENDMTDTVLAQLNAGAPAANATESTKTDAKPDGKK